MIEKKEIKENKSSQSERQNGKQRARNKKNEKWIPILYITRAVHMCMDFFSPFVHEIQDAPCITM